MAYLYLKPTVEYKPKRHRVTYTHVRARVQRSTDGLTWEDAHSENLPLGAQPPRLQIPDAPGKYRVGFALTNGVDFDTEVFTNTVTNTEEA